jgi:hypothetical protein
MMTDFARKLEGELVEKDKRISELRTSLMRAALIVKQIKLAAIKPRKLGGRMAHEAAMKAL